ncbi:hypothetical protein PFNF54_04831 [Plasmodium falciparum NF54]|uniref:Rifin n=1 Tax=Plasmodium falciparum (isolate NF54) TaxID=5843 RepID=W7JZE9_PLAFO|nr:hypothetical protein PFNF54_04831 [Plasmodium falciparum NF54]
MTIIIYIYKRQKRKEERDKDIQKIILKDKVEKSLAEKVEKGCLKCGCGLAGVATSVSIIGPIAVNEWTKAALLSAKSSAIAEGNIKGIEAGVNAGIKAVIDGLKSKFSLDIVAGKALEDLVTKTTYLNKNLLSEPFHIQYQSMCVGPTADIDKPLCAFNIKNDTTWALKAIDGNVEKIISEAIKTTDTVTSNVTASEIPSIEALEKAAIEITCSNFHTAIIVSVVAILVIVLVMVIIYLILRYRRKKKMNKKQQYTKLLNQ